MDAAYGQPAFTSARAEDSASCSERNASPDEVRGRSDRSQIVPRTVRREVYKERRQGSALYISCRFSRPSRGNRKTWLNFKRHAMAFEIWPVPPQRPHRPGYRILFPALVSKLPLADGSFPASDTKTVFK